MIIDKDHRRVQAAVRGTILHYNRLWRKAPSQIWRDKSYRSWWNRRHQTDQLVSEFVMLHALSRASSASPKNRKRYNWKVRIKKYPTPKELDGIRESIQEMSQQYNCPKFLVKLLIDFKQ